jgi:VanZ family protein
LRRLWFAGFLAHSAMVVLISIGAYTGRLPNAIPSIPHLDLLGHAILIGGLAFFLDGALGYRRLLAGSAFPRLAPVLILIGAGVEEYLQRLSPRRESSLSDFAADVIGVCLLCWASQRVHEAITARRALAPA